jgi:hypothetical protein
MKHTTNFEFIVDLWAISGGEGGTAITISKRLRRRFLANALICRSCQSTRRRQRWQGTQIPNSGAVFGVR